MLRGVDAEARVCFIGDSFVNGTGDDTCLGWTGRVGAALRHVGYDLTVYNLGVRRETSADIAARWLAEVTPRLPDPATGRLVFSFGVNDTTLEPEGPRVVPSDSVLHLRTILTMATARFPTLMVGPAPIDDADQNTRILALSDAFAQVCQTTGVPFLEVCRPLLESARWRAEVAAGDGAHPNAGGYAEYASLVAAWPAWRAWWPLLRPALAHRP